MFTLRPGICACRSAAAPTAKAVDRASRRSTTTVGWKRTKDIRILRFCKTRVSRVEKITGEEEYKAGLCGKNNKTAHGKDELLETARPYLGAIITGKLRRSDRGSRPDGRKYRQSACPPGTSG